MQNLAWREQDPSAVLTTAVVEEGGEDSCRLQAPDGGFTARRAAGCLVRPEAGDLVLVAHLAEGESFVLSVLQRAGRRPLRLEAGPAPGLEISAGQGDLDLAAGGELNLAAGRSLHMGAPHLELSARRGRLVMEELEVWARSLAAGLEGVRLRVRNLRSRVDHLLSRLKSRFTRVEGLDRLEAATIDQQAEDLFCAHGRYSQLTAEQDVQVDGSMIHLG